MSDAALAMTAYEKLCSMLDGKGWKYEKDEERLSVFTGYAGDDIPISLHIKVDAERMMILFISKLPFEVKEEKRLDVVLAVSAINDRLAHGCFDFNLKDGGMFYRLSNSFINTQVSENLFDYMLGCILHTVDKYNDKLFALAENALSIDAFLSETIN